MNYTRHQSTSEKIISLLGAIGSCGIVFIGVYGYIEFLSSRKIYEEAGMQNIEDSRLEGIVIKESGTLVDGQTTIGREKDKTYFLRVKADDGMIYTMEVCNVIMGPFQNTYNTKSLLAESIVPGSRVSFPTMNGLYEKTFGLDNLGRVAVESVIIMPPSEIEPLAK